MPHHSMHLIDWSADENTKLKVNIGTDQGSLNKKKNDQTKLPTVQTKYARGIRYPFEPELEPVPVILA